MLWILLLDTYLLTHTNILHYQIFCQDTWHVIRIFALCIKLILLQWILNFPLIIWRWGFIRECRKYSSDRTPKNIVMNKLKDWRYPYDGTSDHALSLGSQTSWRNEWLNCTLMKNNCSPLARTYLSHESFIVGVLDSTLVLSLIPAIFFVDRRVH